MDERKVIDLRKSSSVAINIKFMPSEYNISDLYLCVCVFDQNGLDTCLFFIVTIVDARWFLTGYRRVPKEFW